MKIQNITETGDIPSPLPNTLTHVSSFIKSDTLDNIVHEVVKRFINIELLSGFTNLAENTDEYARKTLSLLLLHREFQVSVCEGDGEHVLRVWKFLILIFKASNKVNNSIEPSTCWHNTTYYYPLD